MAVALTQKYPHAKTTRVRQYFDSNPDEILTLEDARVKFGMTPKQLARCLETLKQQGAVQTATCIMRTAEARK